MMGSLETDDETNASLARSISDETTFPIDDDRMYFWVREGFSNTQLSEGFCEEILVTSEMINGEIIIDGWWQHDLSIGDYFTMHSKDEYALNCMKLTDHSTSL